MFSLLITIMQLSTTLAQMSKDPALDQIITFREKHSNPIGTLTTSLGAPVSYTDANSTLNTRLLLNEYFMDSMTHFVRERISERVVHAKGVGAFGYFEVTNSIADICRASLFSEVGKKTKVAVRFSTATQQTGGNDLDRNIRGFSVKFYTDDGIFDMVGANTPVYAFKDPRFFTAFLHSMRNNPATNVNDSNSVWDFITHEPSSIFTALIVFGDGGIPDGYKHMPGFGLHTFQIENSDRQTYFVRFHLTPDAGIKNLTSHEARRIQSVDPDYFARDLYRSIGNSDYPSWTLSVQVLSLDEAKEAGSYAFDVTRILPLDQYPLTPVGKLVLNGTVTNYFRETEQIAFNPGNLVPGILGGPDKLFEARRYAYRQAQYYRLGTNFQRISVNCPFQSKVLTYNRDGHPPVGNNGFDSPNYYANSFNGPIPNDDNRTTLIELSEGPPNNIEQMIDYLNQLSEEELSRLTENILYSLRPAKRSIQNRAVKEFSAVSPELGRRVSQGL